MKKAMIAGATFHESCNGSGDAGLRGLTGSITGPTWVAHYSHTAGLTHLFPITYTNCLP